MTEIIPPSLSKGSEIIKTAVQTLPEQPGVYRMINLKGDIVYVGKAKNLKKRVPWYGRIDQLPHRFRRMLSELRSVEITTTHTEIEALLLECNLIKRHKPRYNILLKDDKSFPYILLDYSHPFPRIKKHRGPQSIKGDYFGPFASSEAVDEAILTIQKVFMIRNCTDDYYKSRTRPCLQYHIKRCSAPCVQKISKEKYDQALVDAKKFLNGKTDQIQKSLAKDMEIASLDRRYEEAAQIRDRIKFLTHIQSRQRINIGNIRDADIIALGEAYGKTCLQIFFFRHGRNFGTHHYFLAHTEESSPEEKMAAFLGQFYEERCPPKSIILSHRPEGIDLIQKALAEKYGIALKIEIPKRGPKSEVLKHALSNAIAQATQQSATEENTKKVFDEIKEFFELPHTPQRVEIYDNSHTQGTNAVGVMVVATPEGFEKKSYRKFNIKHVTEGGGDDFAMMAEVMRRRFKPTEDRLVPDLMIIDGGAGQVSAVLEVLKELALDVQFVGMAKGPNRNAGEERFFFPGHKIPRDLPKNGILMHFLQQLRDESHRFAIGTHRAKRQKNMVKSGLDTIPGIGPKRKKALLNHFGSAKAVASAGLADLQLTPGIDRAVAKIIYAHFHES
jgi:excinuclease ABC subunit C